MNKKIGTLLQLEQNCRNCEDLEELEYNIVNMTRRLVDYEQAFLFTVSFNNKLYVEAVSDVAIIESTSPVIHTMENLVKELMQSDNKNELHEIDKNKCFSTSIKNDLAEFPSKLLWVPMILKKEDKEVRYYLLLIRQEEWKEDEKSVLKHLANSYSYFIFALRKCNWKAFGSNKGAFSRYVKYTITILFIAMFIPVKLSVLAPVEVVPKNPFVVTSPLDGVVQKVIVEPSQSVKQGDIVAQIEPFEYQNSFTIASRALEIAKAQLHTAKQGSFVDRRQKGYLDQLKSEVELKKSEVKYAKEMLEKTTLYANKSGTAIIDNVSSWSGKPVKVGERIFLLADTKDIELKIMLPVGDTIFLKKGAIVKIFFDNDPLNSWSAKVSHSSYKPKLNMQDILSYDVAAEFDDIKENKYIPKIGIRGTAKIYSDEVVMFFYLFRKPLTTLRQWVGW